jgi:RecA-family ATPase
VASGGKALGKINVEQGAVLYAALEDNPRRLQARLRAVLDGTDVPDDLHITTSLPRLPDLRAFLAGWLDANPNARLVIVDVLRKVRPLGDGRGNAYNEDYDSMGTLKGLADEYGVAIIAVHHTRKMADDSDVFNEVSGSTGLTGAADAILVAKRARNTSEAVLHVTGRDINEQEHGLIWHPDQCMWTLSEEPVVFSTMSETRRQILEDVKEHPLAAPSDIAERTGIRLNTVQQSVRRMVSDDQLDSDGQGHYLPPLSVSVPSVLSVIDSLADTTDTTDSGLEGVVL